MSRRTVTDPSFVVPVTKLKRPLTVAPSSAGDRVAARQWSITKKHFGDILDVIREWTHAVERHPEAAGPMGEEMLRDTLLITLNKQFGPTGGEMFSRSGRTDIAVMHESGAVFIAECKFWSGEKEFVGAIEQLLGYLIWRDTKGALVLFVREKNVTEIDRKARKVLGEHQRFKRQDADVAGCPVFILHHEGDPLKEIEVALVLVAVPPAKGKRALKRLRPLVQKRKDAKVKELASEMSPMLRGLQRTRDRLADSLDVPNPMDLVYRFGRELDHQEHDSSEPAKRVRDHALEQVRQQTLHDPVWEQLDRWRSAVSAYERDFHDLLLTIEGDLITRSGMSRAYGKSYGPGSKPSALSMFLVVPVHYALDLIAGRAPAAWESRVEAFGDGKTYRLKAGPGPMVSPDAAVGPLEAMEAIRNVQADFVDDLVGDQRLATLHERYLDLADRARALRELLKQST